MYRFKEGWYRGRILNKQATDGTVKVNKRICNYRVFYMVFYEADDEMLNQPLYSQTYAS